MKILIFSAFIFATIPFSSKATHKTVNNAVIEGTVDEAPLSHILIKPIARISLESNGSVPEKNLPDQTNFKNLRQVVHKSVENAFPMQLVANASIDSKGKLRIHLKREDVPISKRLRFNFMANTDKKYRFGFRYVVNKYLNLSTRFASDKKFGAGITIVY